MGVRARVRVCMRVCVCVCVCVRVRGRSMATLLSHSGAHRRRTEVHRRPQLKLLRPLLLLPETPERSCRLHIIMEAWAKHCARRQCATTMLSSIVARRVRFMVYFLRHNTRCVNP
jgi:hypothetical protein